MINLSDSAINQQHLNWIDIKNQMECMENLREFAKSSGEFNFAQLSESKQQKKKNKTHTTNIISFNCMVTSVVESLKNYKWNDFTEIEFQKRRATNETVNEVEDVHKRITLNDSRL